MAWKKTFLTKCAAGVQRHRLRFNIGGIRMFYLSSTKMPAPVIYSATESKSLEGS